MIQVASIGYPRIGPKRELKKALEQFWKGEIQEQDLHYTMLLKIYANRIGKHKKVLVWI